MVYLYGLALTGYLLLRVSALDSSLISLIHTFAPYYFLPLPFALLLALVGRWRVLTVWLGLMAVVGLAWFAPYFAPKAVSQAEPDLTLVTYNMKRETLELAPWLRELNTDLVFLQEIPYDPAYLGALRQELADLYPYATAQQAGWGNVILSRYPLSNTANIVSWGGTPPLRADIDMAGQLVTVYNVHFRNPLDRELEPRTFQERVKTAYNSAPRNRQIARLVELLHAASPRVVVAGDFNMSEYDLIYHDLTEVATDSFREVGVGLGNTWPDARKFLMVPDVLPPLLRLDYVWHGTGFVALSAQRQDPLGSDHYPLSVDLAFTASQ